MPVRFDHDVCDCFDVVLRDSIVKEVTHGVHKYHFWSSPTERFAELFWNKTQVESLLVWVILHTAKSFSKHFGVAVLASGADLRAATNRIPRRIRPLDGAVNAHLSFPFGKRTTTVSAKVTSPLRVGRFCAGG